MSQVLVVDDEPSICWAFEQALTEEGHDVVTVATADEALAASAQWTPDVILLDVRLPGDDGFTALERLRRRLKETPVVFMTAFGNLDTAVQAIGAGAFEYLTKPFDLEEAVDVVRRALELSNRPLSTGASSAEPMAPQGQLVGRSPAMQAVFRQIALVADHDVSVLITGESGTGKELVAMALHRHGPRAKGPFVPVCVPAMSEPLVESELFGHVAGAFTGATGPRMGLLAQANHGIAFFDEIGDISLATQVKLLRVLETKQVLPVGSNESVHSNFRLVAATNRNIEEMVRAGEFREDLYYRLNVFRIDLPPLRSRRDDIPLLAEHFLSLLHGPGRFELSRAALEELSQRPWHGNVRELRNVIEHAAILARSGRIERENLPPPIEHADSSTVTHDTLQSALQQWLAVRAEDEATGVGLYEELLREAEPLLFEFALKASVGNRQQAAKLLGIHRETLREKMRKRGMGE
jgi:two-component system nitrogen regulation response regulator GlnG